LPVYKKNHVQQAKDIVSGTHLAKLCSMKWVYLIQSVMQPDQIYIGLTSNLDIRLQTHNRGQSLHTKKYRPLKIIVGLQFEDDRKAVKFERYLKSVSGQAFLHRHFK
jgi:predicted GIY-YIG superfamily endonuclease